MRVKTPKTGNFAGKQMAGFMSGSNNETDYTFFGFLVDGTVKFWRNFSNNQPAERLTRITRALEIIKAYALNSGRCYVCNRLLTNPARIASGIGSECASRR